MVQRTWKMIQRGRAQQHGCEVDFQIYGEARRRDQIIFGTFRLPSNDKKVRSLNFILFGNSFGRA